MQSIPAALHLAGETAIHRDHAELWLALAAIGLAVIIGSSLRVVQQDEQAVISRFGRVIRTRGAGLRCRIPGVERLTRISIRPTSVLLMVGATTRDGVPVHVVGSARYQVLDPVRALGASPDLSTAVAVAIELVLARETGRADVTQLLPMLEDLERRAPRETSMSTEPIGVEVLEVQVAAIETKLTSGLLRSLHVPTEAGDR